MHIVHTESSLGWGGQEIRVLTEAAGMARRGHRVTLLTPAEARIHAEAGKYGVEAVALPIAWKRPQGWLALRRWLAAARPDVINTHSSTDSWLAALSGAGAPIVRTRHISAPVGATPWNRWLYGSAVRRVVTTGESLRNDLVRTLRLPEEHVISIPTGIDVARFGAAREAALGIPAGAFVFGIVATLRSWKGHQDLLDAFARVEHQGDFHLVIAGDGPQRPHLEKALAQRDSARVHLLGHREDVPEVMAALDCFVLPSYANEGVPQAIMQAMAAGLPVISTRVGAIDEAVRDGETGVLVAPRDPAALAAAMLDLARSPARREAMGGRGRAVAEQNFSLERMLERMEAVFRAA